MHRPTLDRRNWRALLLTSAAVSAFAVTPAFAQDAVEDEEEAERMVVTGSRLSGSPVSAAAPIVQINTEDLALRGTTQIEDYLNTLPQAFAGQTSEVANGANGTSTVNLRGLGAVRTLPLINGRRLPYGGVTAAASNIDLVPAQLVERIDVVTGGASAVYGSDAIAGVVNFVLKDDFEGFQVDVQGSMFHDQNDNEDAQEILRNSDVAVPDSLWDGYRASIAAIFGANTADDRGNVTLYFQYLRQGEMIGEDHDIGACTLGETSCVGSSNFRRVNSNTGLGAFFQEEDGTLVPLVGGSAQTFNFGAFNAFQRPTERFTIFGSAHYDITDYIRGYMEVEYQDNSTDAQIAPSASFNRNFQVNCDSPFINAGNPNNDPDGVTYFDILGCEGDEDGIVDFIHSHRNVEGLPRVLTFDFATFRVVGGVDGRFFDDNFSYDVFAQFARTTGDRISRGDLSVANVQQALFVTTDDNGIPVCQDTTGNCVPWNIFTRSGGTTDVTADAAAFVQGTGITVGSIEQVVIGGTLSAELGDYGYKMPWADEGLQVLGGFEFRGDTLERIPDEISQLGNAGLTGTGGAVTELEGEVRVREVFTEVKIPLIQGQELIQDLTIQGAYRYSDYTVDDNAGFERTFDATTFNGGVTWQPVDDIRFRAQFQRAIRAPNVFELFADVTSGLFDIEDEDPCSGDTPRATFEECARTGVTAAQYGNIEESAAGQYNQITGGNRDLDPESSDTFTIGAVFTPRFAEGLTVTVDYFNIDIEDYINQIPPETILDECLETGNSAFCSLIRRDVDGTLWLRATTEDGRLAGVEATNQNIAAYTTEGIDIKATYSLDLNDYAEVGEWGLLDISYAATYLMTLDFESFDGADVSECAGAYLGECTGAGSVVGVPSPKYRHLASFTWRTPVDLDVRATWRYMGSADGIDADPGSFNEEVETRNYLDLALGYQVHEDVRLRAGINNVFDTDPPIVIDPGTGQGNNNTFPGVYPSTGRFVFVGVTINR